MSYSAYATLPVPTFSGPLWSNFASFARDRVLSVLESGIHVGELEIVDSTGRRSFGTPRKEGKYAHIEVLNETFWLRIITSYNTGFSEAYMAGDFTTPDLKAVLCMFLDNRGTLGGLASIYYLVSSGIYIAYTRLFGHGLREAVDNVAGYDASNELYKAFLSREMQYSVPIWGAGEGGPRGDLEGRSFPGDLEAAQARKLAHVLAKARVRPGDRILEVGSGWGGMAIAAAKMGCMVDTLTLSAEQKKLADERIAAAGFSSQVRVHLMDYRNVPEDFNGKFDAFVSMEMLEVVGRKFMPTYFKVIDRTLKPDRGAAVLTAAALPEAVYTPLQGNDFVRKYHWPQAVLPSASSLVADAQLAVRGKLSLDSVDDFGCHYPRALREWGRRLKKNWTVELEQSLIDRYPELSQPENMGVFRRKWEYMFEYMAVAYSRVYLSCPCWCFVRTGCPAVVCD